MESNSTSVSIVNKPNDNSVVLKDVFCYVLRFSFKKLTHARREGVSERKCAVVYGEKEGLRYFLLQLCAHILSTIVIEMLMYHLIIPERYLKE